MPRGWRQFFRPSTALIYSDVTSISAVMAQGASKPHDTNIGGGTSPKWKLRQGGATALAAPAVADGGAAEFDVAISGTGPWDITLTWVSAGLQALSKGVTTRQVQVTSAGAVNTPLNIPVRIEVR